MSTEVYFSTKEELFIFGCACLLGVFFGAVYQLLRVVRAVLPHNRVMVFLEDFFYMLFVSLCFFVFSMELVRGELRLFVLLGNIAGFFAFHYTAGNILVFCVRKVVFFIKKWIFLPLWNVTGKPVLMGFRKISTKTFQVFVQNCKRLKKSEKSRKKHLKVDNRVVYNENV